MGPSIVSWDGVYKKPEIQVCDPNLHLKHLTLTSILFDRRPASFEYYIFWILPLDTFTKMHFSLATIVLGLAAVASALPQDSTVVARQNANRPVPSGNCCVANTNLKQDACTAANGQTGRCVPGGNNCKFIPTSLRVMVKGC
jgi:hypothetical protein